MDPFGNPQGTWLAGLHPHQDGTPTTSTNASAAHANAPPTQQQQQQPQPQPPPAQQQHPHVVQVCAEVKPRLTKEQHDILERHFQQQPKPSTNVKKGFAEALGVPLDKINNWFQNRRAKVKQDLKKQMNALAVMRGHLAAHSPRSQAPFMPITQSLPSSAAPDFMTPGGLLPPADFPSQSMPRSTGSDTRTVIAAPGHVRHPSDFNHMVPTILETPQAHHPGGMLHNLQTVGFAVQEPAMVSGISPEDPLAFHSPFPADFVTAAEFGSVPAMNDFGSAPFGDLPQDLSHSFGFPSFLQTAASSAPAMEAGMPLAEPSSLGSMPSSSSIDSIPSLAASYGNVNWSEESNAPLTIATSSPPSDLDSSCTDPPAQMLNELWPAPPKPLYQQSNPSAPMLSTPSQEDNSTQLGAPEFPSEAYVRRNSSTSALADSLNSVGIDGQSENDPSFKEPAEPSSIAARRQRPRPAALGAAALRSASYTNGMPVSPGSQNLSAPEHQLRRIWSSGMGNGGRIQKPGAPGQRSPLNFTFAEAAASPKFARHASMQSNVSSPAVSVTASSLAPPTPSTPNDFSQWPPWQAQVPKFTSPESLNPNGVAVSWEGSTIGNPLMVNVSSPPETPLDADQAAQFRAYMHHQQAMGILHDTPPQSAPATQQTFQTSMMPPSQSLAPPTADNKMSHLRRPSLPDGAHAVPIRTLNCMQQWQAGVPMFNAAGELQLSQPLHCEVPNRFQQPSPPQMVYGNQFTTSPPAPSVIKPDFSVHEYSPPHSNGTASPPRSDSVAPKVYHFNNAGPDDFQVKQE